MPRVVTLFRFNEMIQESPIIIKNWHTQPSEIKLYQTSLITWGEKHFQKYPWRQYREPYHILIAEIMLHRTQARQVVPVYKLFISTYPDLKTLLNTRQVEVREIMRPLGLQWRIDLFFEMTEEIKIKWGGVIPIERDDLLSLPGVSEYMAGAVRCFGLNLPEPLIDTNIVRVVGRLFNLEIKDSSRRNPRYKEIVGKLQSNDEPAVYNYALLDLAHLVCLKRSDPKCKKCPLFSRCSYAKKIQLNNTNHTGL